jgi:hypothetical protein
MKYLVVVAMLGLAGCATRPAPQAMSYEQLSRIQLTDQDCPRIENIISNTEQQLKSRGIYGRQPEELTEEERLYNSRARAIIWGLRVNCNNPNRYNK